MSVSARSVRIIWGCIAPRLLYGRVALCTLVLALAVVRPTPAAKADSGTTTIPAAVVNGALYNAAWNATYTTNRDEMLYLSRVLQELYAQNPTLDPGTADSDLRQIETLYENQLSLGQTEQTLTDTSWDEIVLAVTAASAMSPTVGPAVAAAYTYFNDQAVSTWDQPDQLAIGEQPYVPQLAVQSVQSDIEQGALTMAANSNFAVAWDQRFAAEIGASIQNPDARSIIASHPNLVLPSTLTTAIGSDGSMSISLDSLRALAQTQFQNVQQVISGEISLLSSMDAQQSNLVAWASNTALQQQMEAQAAQAAAANQAQIDTAGTTIAVLSTLAGASDPDVGKQIQDFGEAAAKIAEALNKYQEAVAGITDDSKMLTTLGSSLVTGDVVGAVLKIFSIFTDNGPSPDQMILQQIAALRDQLTQLQQQMSSRFDRIDHALNTIYRSMLSQFALIDFNLGVVNGGVTAVRQELVTIESTLRQLEADVHSFLNAGFRRDLLDTINGAIGYKQRTGATMPYQPDYVNNENVFQSWATLNDYDALDVAAAPFSFDDGSVYNQLTAYPLDYNITYLAQLPQRFGLPSLTSVALANPRDWALSGRAYAALAQDWPQWAQRIDPARAAAVSSVGQDLRTALRHITTLDTPSGPQPNTALFNALSSNYAQKISALDSSLQGEEQTVLAALKASLGRQGAPDIDFWGGPSQTTTYVPSTIAAMGPCSAAPPASGTGAPASLPGLIVSPYVLADYLKLDANGIDACYTLSWTDTYETENSKTGVIQEHGKLDVDVAVRYNGAPASSYYVKGPYVVYQSYGPTGGSTLNIGTYFSDNWTSGLNLKAQFEAGPTADAPTAAEQQLLSTEQAAVQSALLADQQTVYNQVVTDLNAAGPLHTVAQNLNSAKLLLSAYITLGLPRALEANDYLRSFLDGNQGLMDTPMLLSTYATATPAAGQPNLRTTTIAALNQRLSALSGLLTSYLNLVAGQADTETHPLIETTMGRMQVSRLLIQVPISYPAPATTASVSLAPNAAGWNNGPVTVSLTATTALGAPRIAATYDALDTTACAPSTLSSCTTYGGPITVSTEGTHTLSYFSADTAGDVEAVKTLGVKIDQTPPHTVDTLSGTAVSGGYAGPVQVTLGANDGLSGVAGTRYQIDGGATQTYSGPFTISAVGAHTVTFYSSDNAGNVEAMQPASFTIVTPPTATNTPFPPTATATRTSIPPTATAANTPVPPTATVTATTTNTPSPVPPTNTSTPLPPTATATKTPVPPTATATPTSTLLATNTPLPPMATATATALPPTLVLSRTSGRYKDAMTANGTGLGAGETVNLYLDTTVSTPLTSSLSAASGAVSLTFSVPQAISGTHSIIVQGQSSGRSATAPFTILPGAFLLHYQGSKGTVDVLKGTGFAAHETILGYWITTSGAPFTVTATTNSVGTFGGSSSYPGITFTVPLSPSGQYPVYAVGQSSGGVVHATFTLNPHLSISPTSGHAGATVTLSGTGYSAHETVTLKYNCGTNGCSSTTILATPSTDGNGAFSVQAAIPASTSVGTHSVGATGGSSGAFATATYIVTS